MKTLHDPSAARSWRARMLRLGHRRLVLAITLVSVVSATALALAGVLLQGLRGRQVIPGMIIASSVAAIVAFTATNLLVRLFFELEEARTRLLQMAIRDNLTQAYNRHYFLARLDGSIKQALAVRQPLSLVMLDADDFKSINDRYGHACGDRTLQAIARVCSDALRENDVLARYGGEEFVALLPDTSLINACEIAERVRVAVALVRIATGTGQWIGVTVSLGVSTLGGGDVEPAPLLDRADKALYEAKRGGRNRWVVEGRALPTPDVAQHASG